jgi:hypothetical protein
MKRIVLIGATTLLLMFGSVAAVFSQPDRPDDQKEKHGDKNDNQGKGKADAPGQNKQHGQPPAQQQPAPQQQPATQQGHGRQKQEQPARQQGEQARQQGQRAPQQAQPQPQIKQVSHEQTRRAHQQQDLRPAAAQRQAREPARQPAFSQPQAQAAQQTHGRARVASRQDQTRLQASAAQQQNRLPQAQQQLRITQGQQQATAYQTVLNQQVRTGQTENAQIRQSRGAQYLIQQQYASRLQQQSTQFQRDRSYDYNSDPYFGTPWSYRYTFAGRYVETNRYGADVLRQSVRYGYQEGFYAGDADRRDHWRNNYRDSFAYRDANYGYAGRYVNQREYNYYFREGFRRGYEDGYYRRTHYGHRVNGSVTILSVEIPRILRLQVIR